MTDTFLSEEDLSVLDQNLPVVQTIPNEVAVNTSDLKSGYNPINLPRDLQEIEGEANKKTFSQEMEVYDALIHNNLGSFRYASNISAVTSLTRSTLQILRQRRATLEHAIRLKKEEKKEEKLPPPPPPPPPPSVIVVEYDVMGNEVIRKA